MAERGIGEILRMMAADGLGEEFGGGPRVSVITPDQLSGMGGEDDLMSIFGGDAGEDPDGIAGMLGSLMSEFMGQDNPLSHEIASAIRETYGEGALRDCTNDICPMDYHIAEDLSNRVEERIEHDLIFFNANRTLPLENLTCRLDLYEPQNESQGKALGLAYRMLSAPMHQSAGIYLIGDAGLGKTALSVGLAKEFGFNEDEHKRLRPFYVKADDEDMLIDAMDEIGPQQFWIVDDLEKESGLAMEFLRKLVTYAHDRGTVRVAITANEQFDDMKRDSFLADLYRTGQVRLDSRVSKMFAVHGLEGDDYRQNQAWWL